MDVVQIPTLISMHVPGSQSQRSEISDLTWPGLLAHWTAFAQASVALPKNAEGDRWRAAVPAIISLQAVTFALGDLDKLSADEDRAVAQDKAQIVMRGAMKQLHELWNADPLPDELAALGSDASTALKLAKSSGVEWRATEDGTRLAHPGDLVERLLELQFDGDLFVATPGVQMFRGAPIAFARCADGSRPDEHVIRAVKEFLVDASRPERVTDLRQVYRQYDFALGRAARDLVAPMHFGIAPGQPLLVVAIEDGLPVAVTLPPRRGADQSPLPIVIQTEPFESNDSPERSSR